uniref:Dehydrogenase/reductase 2 n=1 Tax=Catagonus wagneri TaxID=51154 RepID=A0A8C3X387_9CETA
MRLWVRSLASLRGLRIRHCRELWCRSQTRLGSGMAVAVAGSCRIGFAIARRLAQDGAHVVISSRKQENVEQAVATLRGEGLRVTGTVCHMGKAEDRDRLVATVLESCGGVDILVCAPAVNPLVGGVLKSSEQVWDKILTVNVKSPALLLSQLLPYMENRGSGLHSLVPSSSLFISYNVSKTALLGLTKTLAVELAPKNIRVNLRNNKESQKRKLTI